MDIVKLFLNLIHVVRQ